MNKSKSLIILLVCIALVVTVVVYLIPNDKKKIRKQFDNAAKNMNKSQSENVIMNAAKSKSVASLLTDPCELSIKVQFAGNLNGFYGRNDAAMILAAARSSLNSLNFTFHDIEIELEGKEEAKVNLTVRMTGKTGENEAFSEVKEVICDMVKVEKKWLFKKCKAVEVFKR